MARCLPILLGEKSGLDPEMKKLYQKNGLGHLLAISGLHMSLIGMSVYRLLRRMGNSFLFSGIAGGGILFFYLVMTGFSRYLVFVHFLCFLSAWGQKLPGEMWINSYKPGGYSSYLKRSYRTGCVCFRCSIFTFVWCTSWGFCCCIRFLNREARLKAWEGV